MDAQCQSQVCYDGKVCCDAVCSGCSSCLMADTTVPDGTCAPVAMGDPNKACTALGGPCNGKGQCVCAAPACGGMCTAKCAVGETCGADGDCQAGLHCANGVCCSSDCGSMGGCYACNLAPYWVGTCTPLFVGAGCGPNHACDANHSCNPAGGAAPGANGATCGTDTQCASGRCDTTQMKCAASQPTGAACATDDQCHSASCDATTHTCN
jgi:hypothetical protein